MIDKVFMDEVRRLASEGVSVAVDFDSTIALTDGYPNVIGPNGGVFNILHKWQDMGCKIILNTLRVGKDLDAAVIWCANCGFFFDSVNRNEEYESRFGKCVNKLYATFYIDDKNMFTPMTTDNYGSSVPDIREHVDWVKVDEVYTPIMEEIIKELKNN